jgi:mono/diheme cytochrome c family protein
MTAIRIGAVGAAAAAFAALTAVTIASRPADATQQFAAQTKRPCGACHQSAAGGGALNGTGKKFKANGNRF